MKPSREVQASHGRSYCSCIPHQGPANAEALYEAIPSQASRHEGTQMCILCMQDQ